MAFLSILHRSIMRMLVQHLFLVGCFAVAKASSFNDDFVITWGDGRARTLDNGKLLDLSLDKTMGSGFESKKEFLFSKTDMQIKLVPGNSAGTVTTFYMSSSGSKRDEIDYEFLGNETGQPYTLHTNLYSQGEGSREQQFRLWFDPTKEFHTYSILWNPHLIMFYVDGTPIRAFKNMETIGVKYPKSQPMKVYASLWDAEDWATQGGCVKTDWSKAPFVATYGKFNIQGADSAPSAGWISQQLDLRTFAKIKWMRKKYMIYDYCSDKERFPYSLPPECKAP